MTDLAFSVDNSSRFIERPKVSHLAAIKRILRHVKGTLGCGILFSASDTSQKFDFHGFTDSNWFGDKEDRKSTIGYIFMFGKTPISWCLKKELVVALSSYEVEYIAASLCECQAMWLMNLLKELGSNEGEATTLLIDNVSTINHAKNPIAHGKRKHIQM
ncbi:secreted RxLR effector protein 161-like [Vicia villosa]|uniref:secreted RxLR effector protein 161-like n=1 Tax=Vicia villosa TaxID=3911 RepID=UPI00273C41A9|nr:secreted RxLR effector protein 161-like [Vicia villosa]